jgi:hypothetical protein
LVGLILDDATSVFVLSVEQVTVRFLVCSLIRATTQYTNAGLIHEAIICNRYGTGPEIA